MVPRIGIGKPTFVSIITNRTIVNRRQNERMVITSAYSGRCTSAIAFFGWHGGVLTEFEDKIVRGFNQCEPDKDLAPFEWTKR